MLLPLTALSAIVSNTDFKSKAEALITFSSSPVATCCSSTWSRSRGEPHDLCLMPAGATTTAHRRRLAAPRLLERRRITFPNGQEYADGLE
jgi:hypothetical protein